LVVRGAGLSMGVDKKPTKNHLGSTALKRQVRPGNFVEQGEFGELHQEKEDQEEKRTPLLLLRPLFFFSSFLSGSSVFFIFFFFGFNFSFGFCFSSSFPVSSSFSFFLGYPVYCFFFLLPVPVFFSVNFVFCSSFIL